MSKFILYDDAYNPDKFSVYEHTKYTRILDKLNKNYNTRHYYKSSYYVISVDPRHLKDIFKFILSQSDGDFQNVMQYIIGDVQSESHSIRETSKHLGISTYKINQYCDLFINKFDYLLSIKHYDSDKTKNNFDFVLELLQDEIRAITNYEDKISRNLCFKERSFPFKRTRMIFTAKKPYEYYLPNIIEKNNISIKLYYECDGIDISKLNLSNRLYNTLKKNNVKTLGDIRNIDFSEITGLGAYRLYELTRTDGKYNQLCENSKCIIEVTIYNHTYTISCDNSDLDTICKNIIDCIIDYDKRGECIILFDFSLKLILFLLSQGYLYINDIEENITAIQNTLRCIDVNLYAEFMFKIYAYIPQKIFYFIRTDEYYGSHLTYRTFVNFIDRYNLHSILQIEELIETHDETIDKCDNYSESRYLDNLRDVYDKLNTIHTILHQ